MQHVLRFAAHWVIVMRQLKALPSDHEAGDQIVRCYVDLLIAIKKVSKTVVVAVNDSLQTAAAVWLSTRIPL
jgi:Nuclear pore protein 84 / 107